MNHNRKGELSIGMLVLLGALFGLLVIAAHAMITGWGAGHLDWGENALLQLIPTLLASIGC